MVPYLVERKRGLFFILILYKWIKREIVVFAKKIFEVFNSFKCIIIKFSLNELSRCCQLELDL